MSLQPKLWLVVGAGILLLIGCLAAAVCWVWGYLGREGYLHPVPYVKYTSDGRVEEEGFRMRERNGLWYQQGTMIRYHPNGTKSVEGRYNHGREAGTWKQWEADGTLTDVTEYADPSDNLARPGDLEMRHTEYQNGVARSVSESWCEKGARATWLNPDGTPSRVEDYDVQGSILRVTVYENGVAKVLPPDAAPKDVASRKAKAADRSKPADAPGPPRRASDLPPGPSAGNQ